MKRKKAMPLSCREVALLQDLYLEFRIPSDQYKRRPRAAARLLRRWNTASGRSDCWENVIHYIISKRKQKKWVTFGDNYLQLAEPNWQVLNEQEWTALEQAYCEVLLAKDLASDNLVYDLNLATAVADRFAVLSGRAMDRMDLAALVMSKRKRGEWVRLKPNAESSLGFSDIDEIDAA